MNNIVPIGAKPMSEDNVSNILLGLFLNYEFGKIIITWSVRTTLRKKVRRSFRL